jgi:hypothetical protein
MKVGVCFVWYLSRYHYLSEEMWIQYFAVVDPEFQKDGGGEHTSISVNLGAKSNCCKKGEGLILPLLWRGS